MLLLFVTRGDIAINFCFCLPYGSNGIFFFSYAIHFEFIWVNVRWNGPIWQAKSIISHSSPLIPLKRDFARARGPEAEYSAREPMSVSRLPTPNQSASQECRFATLNKSKSKTNKQTNKQTNRVEFKARPPVFGLRRVMKTQTFENARGRSLNYYTTVT